MALLKVRQKYGKLKEIDSCDFFYSKIYLVVDVTTGKYISLPEKKKYAFKQESHAKQYLKCMGKLQDIHNLQVVCIDLERLNNG